MMNKENVTRLGQRKPGSIRPRPIKVKLDSIEEKQFLLKCAKNLRNSTVNKDVRIQHDKTRKELMEDRKLFTVNGAPLVILATLFIAVSLRPPSSEQQNSSPALQSC